MRKEFKFRAWNTKESKWMFGYEYPELGGFSLLGEVVLTGQLSSISLKDLDDVEIMQFTGLRDKNGIEIYEGDIVRLLYTDWGSKSSGDPRTIEQYLIDIASIYEVVYEVNEFCVKSKNRYDEESFDSILPGTHGYIEVIGNIHENPELLS